ncbi:hypothetical protein [Polynucleobacter sp. 39-46-10]|jgi:hypothetical protein|uniref:hypothetical protein n=1 Tax=Polynucleobacter sp. 39-46-10 TaxID=1970428 RepID=UPI0025F0A47E|nr:hypothetical protein [Polynucleobacter sp. 39-46-10]
MRYLRIVAIVVLMNLALSGCLASSTSSIGQACNPSVDKGPTWMWPLVCQPGGGA